MLAAKYNVDLNTFTCKMRVTAGTGTYWSKKKVIISTLRRNIDFRIFRTENLQFVSNIKQCTL